MITYILLGRNAVLEPDALRWLLWTQLVDRRIADVTLDTGVRVSTVFMGIDVGQGLECARFYSKPGISSAARATGVAGRWSTWHQAARGHAQVVAELGSSKPCQS